MNGELLAFAGVMALGQFSPGPDMILLTRTALKSGPRAGIETALGIACGLTVHTTLAVGGLALAFERLPVLKETLRWAAAGYLSWLAYRMLREAFVVWYSGGIAETREPTSLRHPFLRGLFCNLLNPKAALFLAAVSAPFLRGVRPEWWPFAIAGIVVGQAAILWSLWACLLQWSPLRSRYEPSAKWVDAAFGLALGALAVRLALG
ncbi:LysE family transporter [bacterium]|nr:LysE family transporter [bacterium]